MDGPTSELLERQWMQTCARIEEQFDEFGWGQPARLLGVLSPEESARRHRLSGNEWVAQALALDLNLTGSRGGSDTCVDIVEMACAGDGVEAMWTKVASPHAIAVVLVWEDDVTLPSGVGQMAPPAQTRLVSLATRAGQQFTIARPRGQAPFLVDRGTYLGIAGTALPRVLDAPCSRAPMDVGDWLGRTALTYAAPALFSLSALVPQPSLLLTPRMVRQVLDATGDGRHDALVEVAKHVMQSAVSAVAIDALGPNAQVLEVVGDEEMRASAADLRRARELTWDQVMTTSNLGSLAPHVVDAREVGWCDTGLLTWLVWVNAPEQRAVCQALEDACGPEIVDSAMAVLARARWTAHP